MISGEDDNLLSDSLDLKSFNYVKPNSLSKPNYLQNEGKLGKLNRY